MGRHRLVKYLRDKCRASLMGRYALVRSDIPNVCSSDLSGLPVGLYRQQWVIQGRSDKNGLGFA